MKIKFLKNFKHSDNGYDIVEHEAGSVKDVSEECGKAAISTQSGIEFDESEIEEPVKNTPEKNKALSGAPKNKGK